MKPPYMSDQRLTSGAAPSAPALVIPSRLPAASAASSHIADRRFQLFLYVQNSKAARQKITGGFLGQTSLSRFEGHDRYFP